MEIEISMEPIEHTFESCSLNFACSAISGKWKPYIIWYLYDAPNGVCRYGELKRRVPYNISHKMFTQQLQELERDHIISRTEYDEKPLRVEYSLTEEGKLLAPVILYLRDWGVIANPKFAETEKTLLARTQGVVEDTSISYAYHSEKLKKSVDIRFQF